jgi:hypothetical protein
MNKAILLLMTAVAMMTVNSSQAGLGWTYDQCVARYGDTISPNLKLKDGVTVACHFLAQGYKITAFFHTSVVSRIGYERASAFDIAGVGNFLRANGPGADWQGPERDAASGSYRWNGTVGGAYGFSACLYDDGCTLVIWTKEDDDFGAANHAQIASGL